MIESAQIRQMTMVERLQALEQLWDAVCRDDVDVPSPAWHAEVLVSRQARAERGEARFLTLDQLKTRLRASES